MQKKLYIQKKKLLSEGYLFEDILTKLELRKSFPKSEVKVKFRSDQSPWITKAIAKSSKKKQRLYEKLLKNRTPKNEEIYKTYKNLFETIKRRSKKKFYSGKLQKFKGDVKKKHGVL